MDLSKVNSSVILCCGCRGMAATRQLLTLSTRARCENVCAPHRAATSVGYELILYNCRHDNHYPSYYGALAANVIEGA